MVAARGMWFAGEQGDQVDQDRCRWSYSAEGLLERLPPVANRLQISHLSIICSNCKRGYLRVDSSEMRAYG